MTTDEKIERLQNQIDELCKRVDVLSGRCVCPRPQPTRQWDYPWYYYEGRGWENSTRPCLHSEEEQWTIY